MSKDYWQVYDYALQVQQMAPVMIRKKIGNKGVGCGLKWASYFKKKYSEEKFLELPKDKKTGLLYPIEYLDEFLKWVPSYFSEACGKKENVFYKPVALNQESVFKNKVVFFQGLDPYDIEKVKSFAEELNISLSNELNKSVNYLVCRDFYCDDLINRAIDLEICIVPYEFFLDRIWSE